MFLGKSVLKKDGLNKSFSALAGRLVFREGGVGRMTGESRAVPTPSESHEERVMKALQADTNARNADAVVEGPRVAAEAQRIDNQAIEESRGWFMSWVHRITGGRSKTQEVEPNETPGAQNTVIGPQDKAIMEMPLETRAILTRQLIEDNDDSGLLKRISAREAQRKKGAEIEGTTNIKDLMKTIRAISESTKKIDGDLEEHQEGMAQLSYLIGRKMGLTKAHAFALYLGAWMHDPGKMEVLINKITRKPARLTDKEYEQMKHHCAIGEKVLKDFDVPELIRKTTFDHQEMWNGRGYPSGIKGEAIPLTARIAALTDAFDAISRERPYEAGQSIKNTVARLQKDSGTHFDPGVIQAMYSVLNDAGINMFSDETIVAEDIVERLAAKHGEGSEYADMLDSEWIGNFIDENEAQLNELLFS